MIAKFPVLTRKGGRCDDCKKSVLGTIYIASQDPDTKAVDYQVCFVHMKQRQRTIQKMARRMNIARQFDNKREVENV